MSIRKDITFPRQKFLHLGTGQYSLNIQHTLCWTFYGYLRNYSFYLYSIRFQYSCGYWQWSPRKKSNFTIMWLFFSFFSINTLIFCWLVVLYSTSMGHAIAFIMLSWSHQSNFIQFTSHFPYLLVMLRNRQKDRMEYWFTNVSLR